jgi:hypothetical protein
MRKRRSHPVNPKSLANLRPRWQPGQSGNPKGRTKKEDCLLSCIKDSLAQKDESGLTREQVIADRLVCLAAEGDLKAIQLVLEYTALKPAAAISLEVAGPGGGAVQVTRIEVVKDYGGSPPPASQSNPTS